MKGKYLKLYKEWNCFKEILNSINITIPFFEGEIWSIAIGVNVGIEIDGKGENFERPVLVIKKFNKDHGLIVPITHIDHPVNGIHFLISHNNLDIRSAVIITQIQRMSNHRLLYKIGTLNNIQFLKIINLIKEMFDPKTQKT